MRIFQVGRRRAVLRRVQGDEVATFRAPEVQTCEEGRGWSSHVRTIGRQAGRGRGLLAPLRARRRRRAKGSRRPRGRSRRLAPGGDATRRVPRAAVPVR